MVVLSVDAQTGKERDARYVELPAGTNMTVRLATTLDSNTTRAGQTFSAELTSPVSSGGKVVFPKGSMVHGIVDEVKQPKLEVKKASITIVFDRVRTPDGRVAPIAAIVPHDFDLEGNLTKGANFAGKFVVKEGLNVATGGLLTPFYVADYARKGVNLTQKDKSVVIPAGSVLQIVLEKPARVPVKN